MMQPAVRLLLRTRPLAATLRALPASPLLSKTARTCWPRDVARSAAFATHAPSAAASVPRPQSPPTSTTPSTPAPREARHAPPNWRVQVLYDGDCPLCMREINLLMRRDSEVNGSSGGAIWFVDLQADDYDPAAHGGVSFRAGMEEIHGVLPSGEVLRGVPVFARLYAAVGWGWVYSWTRWPALAAAAARAYSFWAARRLAVTGRGGLEEVLAARALRKEGMCNSSQACAVPGKSAAVQQKSSAP